MNTFFRTAVYLSFAMIIFTLAINFVYATGAFPVAEPIGQQNITSENVLTKLTGLTGGMEGVWLLVTTIAGITAVGIAILVRSISPIGIYLFGEVFWTAYIRTYGIFASGDFIPADFLLIFSIGMIFLFIAAVIGMLTGSG